MFSMAEHTGALVRSARVRTGVSLRQLATRIGVSPATMSAIENDKAGLSVDRLYAIAEALGTSATEMLRTPEPHHAPRAGAHDDNAPGADWRAFPALNLDPVLMAAISVFVRTGYHGATMRTIATAAHMSVPGVYHHYPSKQRLLVAILDVAMSELHWLIPAARSEGSTPTERFSNMVEALALFHTHRRDLAFIGASEMRSILPPDHDRISALRNDIQYMLDDEAEAAIATGEFRTPHAHDATRAISTMCTSLPSWFQPSGPTSASEIAREYARFAVDIMRAG
jgi:AcrR family transcriptional regulator/transcriptional regulator with XRE-family HTH domain